MYSYSNPGHSSPSNSGPAWAVRVITQGWRSRFSSDRMAIIAASALACVTLTVLSIRAGGWRALLDLEVHDSADEREVLIKALHEINHRFYHVARDLASLARALRHQLDQDGSQFNDKVLRQQLGREFQLAERFQAIERDVMEFFKFDKQSFRNLQDRHRDLPEVSQHADQIEVMLNDALGGVTPLCPGVKIPEQLTEAVLLQIQSEINKIKIEKVRKFSMGNSTKKCNPEELSRAIALLSQAAEAEVLRSKPELLGEGGEDAFYSAMALKCRTPEFQVRVTKLTADHKQAMIAAIRDESKTLD